MLAQDNEAIREASSTVYQLTQEERIRMECEAREDYYRTQNDMQLVLRRSAEKVESQAAEIETLTKEVDRLRKWIADQGQDPSTI